MKWPHRSVLYLCHVIAASHYDCFVNWAHLDISYQCISKAGSMYIKKCSQMKNGVFRLNWLSPTLLYYSLIGSGYMKLTYNNREEKMSWLSDRIFPFDWWLEISSECGNKGSIFSCSSWFSRWLTCTGSFQTSLTLFAI